ncbi:MAG: hypothetical protein ACHP9Y_01310 [Gammaproteobacteria bacterium]
MNILDNVNKLYSLVVATATKSTATIVITIIAAAVGAGSVYFLKAENPVEKAAEEVIKVLDGVTIDLTPGS